MIMKHGMLVCGHCETMVCIHDDGYRCLGCGRDIYVSLIADHYAKLERLWLAQADTANIVRLHGSGHPDPSRDEQMMMIMARLGTFSAMAFATEAGIVGSTATSRIKRFRDLGMVEVINRSKQQGWGRGSNPALYRWVGAAPAPRAVTA